jgi:hypothetical protein
MENIMKATNLKTIVRMTTAVALLLFAAGVLPASVLAGATTGEGANAILDVPKVYSQTAVEQGLKESRGIPWFNGTGVIDKIVENGFVVDDMTLVGTNVDFRSEATGQPIASSFFKPGAKVGFVLNSKNILTSLWLLKEQ